MKDFKFLGYDAVIALRTENKNEPEKSYRGTLNMFIENGFRGNRKTR